MKTCIASLTKRIEKLEAAIRPATATGDGLCLKFCGVSSLAEAVEKASKAGAQSVTFVPLVAPIQRETWDEANSDAATFAIAYEGPEATTEQLRRLVKWADPECQFMEDNTTAGGYSWMDGRAVGDHPGGEVIFRRDGQPSFHIRVDPNELPQPKDG